MELTRWCFSVPGFRVSHASLIDDTYATPWLETQWIGGPSLRLRAAAGLYHQVPDVLQVVGLGGNLDLGLERARYLEGGIGQEVGRWRWDVTVFNRRDMGYVRQTGAETRRVGGVFVSGNPFGQWQNALEGHTHGVEASVERRDSGRWGGWLAYAYGESTYTDSVSRERFWGDYDQRHAVNMYASYQLSARTRATAKIRLGSNFPIPAYVEPGALDLTVSSTRNQTRLPRYARVDLNVSRAFFWSHHRLTLFAELMNVTNHANYRATAGTIRFPRGDAFGFAEKLFPFLPVAGLMIEF
jgi:outer membrane cobalamin receptor